MYSCVGTHTCAGYLGSFVHEFADTQQFAEWGVDFLKYDYCFKPRHISVVLLYKWMSLALKNCGRNILFSACNWGEDDVYHWIRESGAHMYRSTADIQDQWDYSYIFKTCLKNSTAIPMYRLSGPKTQLRR